MEYRRVVSGVEKRTGEKKTITRRRGKKESNHVSGRPFDYNPDETFPWPVGRPINIT